VNNRTDRPKVVHDHLIFKAILGRRFDWGRHSPID
jgi:hypothetical protein